MSIRRTLLVSLLTGLMVCTAIITFVAYFNTAHEMHELFNDNIRQIATVIKEQAFAKGSAPENPNEADIFEPEESSFIQIWDTHDVLLRSSPQEIDLPLQSREGFSTPTIHGQKWNVYTLRADSEGFVQVAQPRKMVATMVGESAMNTLLPFTILFVVLGAGAWLIVGRSLSPLSHLSRHIASQDVDQLRPLSSSAVPSEVRPIIKAINGLLERLDKTIAAQRQFMADAAHELRTPLTAVKLQAELLSRAQSPAERDEGMRNLSEGVDRSINMASQLLSASRCAAVRTAPDFRTIHLHEVVRSCLATFVSIASTKNIDITFEPCDECAIRGDEEGIRALVSNLVDNAIRYTPTGGGVNVSLCKQDGRAVLKVTDTGPGIAEAEKNKIFRRFYRVPGTSSSGAGLGLSIVKDVAENHGAAVVVTDGPQNRGTMFRIVFRFQSASMTA